MKTFKVPLSAEEQIKVMARIGLVEVGIREDHITISFVERKRGPKGATYMKPSTNLLEDIMESTLTSTERGSSFYGTTYVDYYKGQWRVQTPVRVTIIPYEIKYLGLNGHQTPIVEIGGEQYSGYAAISNRVFGYYRKEIKDIIKPYLYTEFDRDQLHFVEYKTYRGRKYPVFTYGESKKLIKGAKGLKALFPQLTDEFIKTLAPETPGVVKERHEEIIEQWGIRLLPMDANGKQFYEVGDRLFEYKTEVVGFLRGEGTKIGQTTAKKMFEELERRQSRV